jgi:hypothetical protein
MKMNKYIKIAAFTLVTGAFFSCEDLTSVNTNPNGVQPDVVNPNLVMPTVLTEMAKLYVNLGYQDIAGVVQHTQKDAWSSGHNDYDWGGNQSWAGYYDILRNNDLLYQRAIAQNLEFHQGVSLVTKAFMFGLITDLWGDAPYTNALKGELGGVANILPTYDSQEVIYTGILADLDKANKLLSKQKSEYSSIVDNVDVIYNGDPVKWRKLANSLALRYYMRISAKKADVAKAGIENIVKNPANYPIITTNAEDATMGFPGTSDGTSWPANAVFDVSGSNYRRIKMANTFVEYLQGVNDPRLGIWAAKVEIPLVVDATLPAGTDKITGGKRYLSPDKVGNSKIDTDQEYVGLPTSFSALPSAYNLNPTPGQTSFNPHVSFLAPMYKNATGALLRARLVSAAEVNFILAEAAQKGWSVGDAKTFYEAGVKASLTTWGVGSSATSYLGTKGVSYDGTLKQIMEQKWIASWTAATEAWFDYRRTGFPALTAGPAAKRQALPVRFYYMQDEIRINAINATSAWSKPWLMQGTGKPW